MTDNGAVTIGGGGSGVAITLSNGFVSSHLSLFTQLTAVVASSAGTYATAGSGSALVVPDGVGAITVLGTAPSGIVVAGTGDPLNFVGVADTAVLATDGNNVAVVSEGDDAIELGDGHNRIVLGSGNSLVLSTGTDTIQGGIGQASIKVEGSGSTIYGVEGGALSVDDTRGQGTTIYAPDGTTVAATTVAGAVTEVFDYGDATISGGAGHVGVTQADGAITFIGHDGSFSLTQQPGVRGDTLYGASGSVIAITGSAHNDVFVANDPSRDGGGGAVFDGSKASGGNQFWAGSGNATLVGGAGDDTLVGGAGASTLTGGAGDNEFDLFAADGGAATNLLITDFDAAGASDVVKLFGYGASGVQFALAHASESSVGTTLHMADGSSITFAGIGLSQVHGVTILSTG